MKNKSITLMILNLLVIQFGAVAQNSPKFMNADNDKDVYNNSVKMNLMNALFSYPTFCYERRIGEHYSAQLEGAFRMGGNSNTASTSYASSSRNASSYVLYPSIRYYYYESTQLKMESYFGLYYKYRHYQSVNDHNGDYTPDNKDYSNTYTETTNGAGLLLGLQTARASHFVFDVYFGTQVQSSSGIWDFYSNDVSINDYKQNYSLSSAADAFSQLNSTSLRAGFTIGVRF